MSLGKRWREIFPRRPRGLDRIRDMEEKLRLAKEYAVSLPEGKELSLIDRFAIWLRPFLKNINPKNP
jgi:hypothetical protein